MDLGTMRIAACLVSNTVDALCAVGEYCGPGPGSTGGSLDLACPIVGKGLDLVQTIGRDIAGPAVFELSARCIGYFVDATTTVCDVVVGSLRQETIYAAAANDTWTASGVYDVDSTAVMFVPTPPIHIWSVFAPFSASIWIILAVLAFVVTPLVSSIVEYVDGETIAGNYKLYLPDSVHAYAGVDALKRTGSMYSRESAVLSAVVAIVAKIIVALYTCNLAAYVLESYMFTTTDAALARGRIVATVPEFATMTETWTLAVFETMTRAYDAYIAGTSGVSAVMGSESFLRLRQRCDESILIVDGPFMFRSMALSKTFAFAEAFDEALRRYVIQRPPVPIAPIQCTQFAQSIQLDSTFGIFVAFVVGIVGATIVGAFMHLTRHTDWTFATLRSLGRDASSVPESGSLPDSGSLPKSDDDDSSHEEGPTRRPITPHNSPERAFS